MKRWEKEGVMESHPQEHQLWNVPILLKMGIDLWRLQVWEQLLTNFLYLRFAFTLQDELVPMLSENFIYILNRWSRIRSLCLFD